MSLAPGQSISGYQILGSLGAGGMGEVFRARDTRLDREVAIKVLPAAWYEDDDHRQRFEREARTLASLNHPNVAQVYSFDEAEGMHLLVLELVDGEDLSVRIARGPLSVDDTIAICRQVAEGLEAAHEAGVIHRDLKPGNVRITPDEKAKVLDFGLAKSLHARSASGNTPTDASSFETVDGALLGTPAYMSPEQVRAKPVDRRADIWAFGCVLYECLVGKPAFEGDTLADTLAAVVRAKPDLSRLPATTPPHIRTLLARCLDPHPRTRLRDIGEARIVLEGGSVVEASRREPAVRRGLPVVVAVGIAVGLAVLAALGAYLLPRRGAEPSVRPPVLWGATTTQLTNFPGTEFGATISRDGKFFAFAADVDGPFNTWLGKVGGGELTNLTSGHRANWWGTIRDMGFNHDGSRLWFLGGNGAPMQSVDIFGGDVTPYFDPEYANVDWSPDGERIVYHSWKPGDNLYVADSDGQNPEKISPGEPGWHQHFCTWSPHGDGGWIFISCGRPATNEMDLYRIRSDGSGLEQLTFGLPLVMYPAPVDERTVLFIAYETEGSGPWMWEVDVETKAVRRAREGVERYLSVAASADGRTLVATVANPRTHLWNVPLREEGVAAESEARRVEELSEMRALAPRFSQDALYFLSSRGADDGLWRLRTDGIVEEVLSGAEHALAETPAVSPDGSAVAVVLRRDGKARLHVVTAEGNIPRKLSDEIEVIGAPTWSPDGRFVAVAGSDASGEGVFKLGAGGDAPPQKLAAGHVINPVWSPRGDVIVYKGPQETAGTHQLLAVTPDGAERAFPPLEIRAGAGQRFRFLPDGSGIVYMQGYTPGQDFFLFDLATEKTRKLTDLVKVWEMNAFDISPDGDRIVFDRVEPNSDIVLIELADRDSER